MPNQTHAEPITILPSPRAAKKWRATFPDGARCDFGSRGASDYTIHKDQDRQRRYLLRHGGRPPKFGSSTREDWTKAGLRTAGFWSRWLLWNEPSLEASARDLRRRFGVKVSLCRNG